MGRQFNVYKKTLYFMSGKNFDTLFIIPTSEMIGINKAVRKAKVRPSINPPPNPILK